MSKQYVNPVNGDPMTRTQAISWRAQTIIRRWTFIGLITLVTVVVWVFFTDNATVLLWWNLGASYLALLIESVVGIGMFNLAGQDSKTLREVSHDEDESLSDLDRIEAKLDQLLDRQ